MEEVQHDEWTSAGRPGPEAWSGEMEQCLLKERASPEEWMEIAEIQDPETAMGNEEELGEPQTEREGPINEMG